MIFCCHSSNKWCIYSISGLIFRPLGKTGTLCLRGGGFFFRSRELVREVWTQLLGAGNLGLQGLEHAELWVDLEAVFGADLTF